MGQLSENDVLAMWEARHGVLSTEHRREFVQRAEATALAKLPHDVVQEAIRGRKKLRSILSRARHLKQSRAQPDLRSSMSDQLNQPQPPSTSDRLQANQPSRPVQQFVRRRRMSPLRLICLACRHEFVAMYDDSTKCYQCSTGDHLEPVCRSCGKRSDRVHADGRCIACLEARVVAIDSAGNGANRNNADRRKLRWNGQLLDGPNE